jgi:hypothetical protein
VSAESAERALSSAVSSISHKEIFAPPAARRRAVAKPMPLAPPEIAAIRPVKFVTIDS